MTGLTALLSTSWTVHRLSPLFDFGEDNAVIGDQDALDSLARRLRDHLRGDAFKEIYTGIDSAAFGNDAVAKAGALKACQWETLPPWRLSHVALEPKPMGILISLEYENVTYKAALIGGPEDSPNTPQGTVDLPLLLTRLPNLLRQTLVAFLCETFDTYCTVLHFPPAFLCHAFETYVGNLKAADEGLIEKVVKDTQLTISFPPPIAPSLKNIQIYVPRTTVMELLSEEGASEGSESGYHFLYGLSDYLSKHLAMHLELVSSKPSRERITKISCNAFVLGSEGKVKLIANLAGDDDRPTRGDEAVWNANEQLLRSLVRRAMGSRAPHH
ncbi:hypothetical protein KEM56_001532 [Ascosphaera pollenicola]|nr:hypothetical protein KEM56_001532 [Ascosphaera pollenicola]